MARTNQVWLLDGNSGTAAGVNFLGTSDSQPLELKVNGSLGWRLEPTVNDVFHSDIVNVVGGSSVNVVGPGVYGAVIGGGGAVNYFVGPGTNRVDADFGTIGGGWINTIQPSAIFSTIGGGGENTIEPRAIYSTIGGGLQNRIQTNADESIIGGGFGNTIQTNAVHATIGGGSVNTVQTDADASTIGGGDENTIEPRAIYSTIGGGEGNTIRTDANRSTISGGGVNIIQTNAEFSTIGGGFRNWIQTNASGSTISGGVTQHDSDRRHLRHRPRGVRECRHQFRICGGSSSQGQSHWRVRLGRFH